MADKESSFKNPICVIKGDPIFIFGGLIDEIIGMGEYPACPKCQSTELHLIKNIYFQPMGFRICCDKCGYAVPEFMEEMAYMTEEGLEKALSVWGSYVAIEEGKELFFGVEPEPIELGGVKLDPETYDFIDEPEGEEK